MAEGTCLLTEMRKFVAPEFVIGAGARHLAGRYLSLLGVTRALLVTDAGVTAARWAGDVAAGLAAHGIACVLFDQVRANPRDYEVEAGARRFAEEDCDGLLAVGGGSPMDCAKGIGVCVANGGTILDYEGVDRVPEPMVPLVCVPTTAGTASEVSQFSIILDSARRVKIAIVSKAVVPDLALVDHETTVTMAAHLTGCTGMDALVHAFEAYVSNASSPLTDLHALDAVRRLARWLPQVVCRPDDLPARAEVMLASLQAGLAFSNASLGAVHAMAHSLGGLLDLPHGACNAMLLPGVIAYNYSAVPHRYRELAAAMGVDTAGLSDAAACARLVEAVGWLRQRTGTSATLSDYGVTDDALPALAQAAAADPCLVTNPRQPSEAELADLFAGAC